MYFSPNDERFSYDFYRPWTADAVRRFDPSLVLAWNREIKRFQVLRHTTVKREVWMPSFGKTMVDSPVLVHVCDYDDVTEKDDPGPLLFQLKQSDTWEHGEYLQNRLEALADQRAATAAKVHALYRGAYLDNRRQLTRAWEPLVRS